MFPTLAEAWILSWFQLVQSVLLKLTPQAEQAVGALGSLSSVGLCCSNSWDHSYQVSSGAGSMQLCKGRSVPWLVSLADREERGRFYSMVVKKTTTDERQSILISSTGRQVWLFLLVFFVVLFCSGFTFLPRVTVSPCIKTYREKV